MAYGPDNDCQLDDSLTTSVAVSPGFGAFLRFDCPVTAERSICIYRADQGPVKLAERRFAFDPWSSGRNDGDEAVVYTVSAWRRMRQPAGGSAWRQVTVRSMLDSRHEASAPRASAPRAAAPESEDLVVVSVDITPQA